MKCCVRYYTSTHLPASQMVVQVNPRTRQSSRTMEGNLQKVEANIVLLGAENVGKSALTVRFLTRRFIGEYGDIESIYSHCDKIDGRDVCFNIWDSLCAQNGGEAARISDRQLQWADGFILVYSICDRASFNVARQQVQRIRQAKAKFSSTAPVIIVGNKRDLQHRRAVSGEEGRLLALSADCGFFEISAAETYHGVVMVFHELLDLIREARALKKGAAGFKGIVRSMSAVFGRKRTE
ncbi:ras-related and estrogen-regulated growth inhibitor-like protein isoform X3 [Brachyhypopomus gauderio]|uniref:ras-related and estrogen-regulated growth inhibitor-like protein isoform X3 n=1 Tax=Brachyhypopomus gauderio TaxID=698409 RepID=UPI004041DB7A